MKYTWHRTLGFYGKTSHQASKQPY